MTAPFRPWPLCTGGHRQTLLGYLVRRRLHWPHPAEDMVVDAGDGVRLLVRASWQHGPREAHAALVLVHGLASCDQAAHIVATGAFAFAQGWHVLRMNMRGAGDSERLCARLYNAGLDADVLAVLSAAARQVPRLALAGFSLGAGLALLAAGRSRAKLPPQLVAIAAVSPPLDLAACADAFERPSNRLYAENFLWELRAAYRSRQRCRPDLYAAGRERGLRSIRAYDDAITAPYGGYRDAAHYYACSSAGPHLVQVDRPALILAAADDPLIPEETVTRWPLSAHAQREILPTGGHVGFVAPTRAPGHFWAAERAIDFLSSSL